MEHSVSQNSKSSSQSLEFITGVIATVTQGNLVAEKGPSLPTVPTLLEDEVPDREKDCMEFVEDPFIQKVAPAAAKVESRVVPGGIKRTFSDHRGRSFREMWLKFADGSHWDVLSLGYLTDVVNRFTLAFRHRC